MTRELVTTIMLDETRVNYDSDEGDSKKKQEGTEVSMEELVSKMR